MNAKLLIIISFIITTHCAKPNSSTVNKTVASGRRISDHDKSKPQNKIKPTPVEDDVITITPRKEIVQVIDPTTVEQWAQEISNILLKTEERVVHRQGLLDGFKEAKIKIGTRNGSAIVDHMAKKMEELLTRRVKAAERIMRRAEALSSGNIRPPPDYVYDRSVELNELKRRMEPESEWDLPETCRSLDKVHTSHSAHFDAEVSLNTSSVHSTSEVFDCDTSIVKHLYWSEGLLSTFKQNYAEDASTDFQYFCSARGFLRHYPAAVWSSLFKVALPEENDSFDCRMRPWYMAAVGAPRDILILVDASGSMNGSSNQVIAQHFTHTLLNALPDDDQVNVLRFNLTVKSPISCFDNKLVPADHVNTAAMMAALYEHTVHNKTNMTYVLGYAVNMLKKLHLSEDRTPSCQQAIVLVTDSLDYNFTDLMRKLDKTGSIRLFVIWLHDQYGIRDNTRAYGHAVSCDRDGYFAEQITDNDVTEQVRRILQVMERPLVAQRQKRLKIFTDVYARVEEPRMSEFHWRKKEDEEQVFRYRQLRKNKSKFLNDTIEYQARLDSLDEMGFYYEGEDINFRLQITVSIPVFDNATFENITIKLDEENQRNATRTYPVNRLLGVAGIDIPVDHLKLILPYHQVGPGGTLFVIDHRGNVVVHDNLKPVFDGDMLKPGYRTVDFIHLEQPAKEYLPRNYPANWLEFRNHVIKHAHGIRVIDGKNVYEGGMRSSSEQREYYWKRVVDHYTAVVVLPPYARRRAAPDPAFTQQAAAEALKSLSRSDFAVHPEWLYCKHVDPHFESRELEVLHFIRRRSDEPNFAMQRLEYPFSLYGKLPPGLLDKTYQCSPDLMARLCREAVATNTWAQQRDELDCPTCGLGSVTAFFASESGLTRWRQYTMTSSYAPPVSGAAWARGPDEPWYRRAAAHDDLVIHAPVSPVRRMRRTELDPPGLGPRGLWLTAARALTLDKGIIGVAGYHFHPRHLEDMLTSITTITCDEPKCNPSCDGINWTCVLIDEGGWIVSGGPKVPDEEPLPEEPVRPHLARVYPTIMAALLKAKVFTLNWLHDYQGVCFGMETPSSATTLPSLIKSIWRTMYVIMQAMHQIVVMTALLTSSGMVSGDTQEEKMKRRNRVRREFEREKYDRLFDPRVLVNRSEYAACDRSRPLYELQRTSQAMEALRKGAVLCSWPLVGAPVPRTNLLLLALYVPCMRAPRRAVPDPLVNQKVNVDELIGAQGWGEMSTESKLACFRNIVPLPGRPPSVPCFQHNYTQEEGYRQCGPWLPDPEVEETNGATSNLSTSLIPLFLSILLKQINK